MSFYSKPVEPDRLFECLPSSLRPSAGSPGQQGEGERKPSSASNSDQQGKGLETAIYKPPTLIPPRLLPLLHDLALHTIQAGKQDQCVKIYWYGYQIFSSIWSITYLFLLLFNRFC